VSPADLGGIIASVSRPPLPGSRVYEQTRPVRLGDADQRGRLRLDAVARHLQDVATDDYADAGLGSTPVVWVVRRAAIAATRWPRYLERVTYATFCAGIGPQWAERRTSGRGDSGGALEASVLWAATDATTGRPVAVPEGFAQIWGVAGATRRVSARLIHDPPPDGDAGRCWALRSADLDVVGHVNNAGHWVAVEDQLARSLPGRDPATAECEYRLPIDLEDRVRIVSHADSDTLRIWLVSDRGVHASAVVTALPAEVR
jgi:acyl-ACP thioesterase